MRGGVPDTSHPRGGSGGEVVCAGSIAQLCLSGRGGGRPGEKTRWRRRLKTRFQLTWSFHRQQIDYDARCDGLFPLITNTALSPKEILDIYKSKQPLVERQHHLLKAGQSGVPVFLKDIARIAVCSTSVS
jgi:transposase